MLKSLSLENFTVFSSAQFEFSPGINVIVGENGTGKTHVLKAGYCINKAWSDLMHDRLDLTYKRAEVYFEKRLMGLFQSDSLKNLIRWGGDEGCISGEMDGIWSHFLEMGSEEITPKPDHEVESASWRLALNNSELRAHFEETKWFLSSAPKSIFIPSKEVVSFYEGLGGILDEYKIKLDSTYRDMVSNFDFPELTMPPKIQPISDIEDTIGGILALEGRRLIFIAKDGKKTETPMMAEGFRKLAMLPYFIRHSLIQGCGETVLFWDEPETNLNPRLISKLAEALVILAREGVQIILATHSLFLLKEIDLQLQLAAESNNKVDSRFFALSLGNDGVEVSAGDSIKDVDPITALDMEIDQADRYNEWFYRVSRAR